ncbi:MAG: NfeD family protein [Bacilli bacterium]|nr:NfeD family protein [Bacilli bacterium]
MVFGWFITFLILLFIEIITVNLVSIWFAIGALAAFVSAFFTDLLPMQLLVFVVVSVISLIVTKPVVKKLRVRKVQATNLDRVLEMDGIVTDLIVPNEIGEVKVDGKRWSAVSSEKIEVGSLVEIMKIDGVKLIVKKKEN